MRRGKYIGPRSPAQTREAAGWLAGRLCEGGVSEGTRTPDPQGHNLVL